MSRACFVVPLLGFGLGCATPDPAVESTAPYVLVLGTAQDGGMPQIGAEHERARAAWRDPARKRLVASLLVADPPSGGRWLIDATPDLREQVERARGHPTSRAARFEGATRPPLFDGIFLTHAHMGHYTGLIHLGREAYAAQATPVHASPSMAAYLLGNGPWDLLVRLRHIELTEFESDRAVPLSADLEITPISVFHRNEYSDAHGFIVSGPSKRLLYIPDIDKWDRWEQSIEEHLAAVDYALVDGTFYADGEIPGRSLADIPHPFIVESMERFAPLPESERRKVVFTHLNHTNPAADAGGEAQARIRALGMSVAEEGQRFEL